MSPYTPSHRSPGEQARIAGLWAALSERVSSTAKDAAREFMVLRARRIWGRLGNLLRRSIWARIWRAANAIPIFALRWVKSWRVTGR